MSKANWWAMALSILSILITLGNLYSDIRAQKKCESGIVVHKEFAGSWTPARDKEGMFLLCGR